MMTSFDQIPRLGDMQIRNSTNDDGDHIQSSIFTGQPKTPYKLESLIARYNKHLIAHNPQSMQPFKTVLKNRNNEDNTW
jgi:hypothetical protein